MSEADDDLQRATRAGRLLFSVGSAVFLALGLLMLYLARPEIPTDGLICLATGVALAIIAFIAPKPLMAGIAYLLTYFPS